MCLPSLKRFALVTMVLIGLVWSASASAVTQVSTCGALGKTNETYVLTANLSASGTCFRVQANGITIDLAGNTLTGPGGAGAGVWDEGLARSSTTVKNGTIQGFAYGILLQPSSRTTIRNVTVLGNSVGLVLGNQALVKSSVVQGNSESGIVLGDAGQVQDCLVGGIPTGTPGGGEANDGEGNGQYGIVAGQRALITANTVNGNGASGILVGISSTVTNNTANENGGDGIAVGLQSLVTGNTANDNGGDGIEAVCKSTVTNNQASNNDALNFNFIGTTCFEKNNTSPDEHGCAAPSGFSGGGQC
jgi:hypothetical protein